MTTHFKYGVTNVSAAADLAILKTMDPTTYHMWFDDFDNYVAGQWVVTETQAGATQAAITGDGGLLKLTNDSADNDVCSLQWAGNSGGAIETFKWVGTKDMLLKARFHVSDATDTDALIGLAITDTSPLASLPSDGIFFYKNDGAAALIASIRKDGTSTSISLGDVVADTFVDVAMVYNAVNRTWTGWADGIVKGSTTTLTNAPDDEELAITLAIQNGAAAAKSMTVDYLMIAKAR